MDADDERDEKDFDARSGDDRPAPSRVLRVANLTQNVTPGHLEEIFAHYGRVRAAHRPPTRAPPPRERRPSRDRHPSPAPNAPGVGLVEFDARDDAEDALRHMHGGDIDGTIVDITFADERALHVARRGRKPHRTQLGPARGEGARRESNPHAFSRAALLRAPRGRDGGGGDHHPTYMHARGRGRHDAAGRGDTSRRRAEWTRADASQHPTRMRDADRDRHRHRDGSRDGRRGASSRRTPSPRGRAGRTVFGRDRRRRSPSWDDDRGRFRGRRGRSRSGSGRRSRSRSRNKSRSRSRSRSRNQSRSRSRSRRGISRRRRARSRSRSRSWSSSRSPSRSRRRRRGRRRGRSESASSSDSDQRRR